MSTIEEFNLERKISGSASKYLIYVQYYLLTTYYTKYRVCVFVACSSKFYKRRYNAVDIGTEYSCTVIRLAYSICFG